MASFNYAAPSCVIPAGVAANALFLAARFAEGKAQGLSEIALCLFEAQACAAYDERDIPPWLGGLPFSWHLHLPVDLPWERSARNPRPESLRQAGRISARLAFAATKPVNFLQPHCAVLHTPAGEAWHKACLIAAFAREWRKLCSIPLLLENTSASQLVELGEDFFKEEDLGVCLDLGHLLGYAQDALYASGLPERARLAHLSAPGKGDEHLPLSALCQGERLKFRQLLRRLPRNECVLLLEIFHWQGLADSVPILAGFIDCESGE